MNIILKAHNVGILQIILQKIIKKYYVRCYKNTIIDA